MKKMDIFCASQASTAVCLSMDQAASSSCSSASAVQLGGRAIDRHNPIIRDAKRFTRTLPSNPCTSQPPPINPLPYHQLKKNEKKCSSKSSNDHARKGSSSSGVSAKLNDHKKKKKGSSKNSTSKPSDIKDAETGRKSSATKAVDFVTPPGSTRCLLGDNNNSGFSDGIPDYDPVWALVPAETSKIQAIKQDQSIVSKPSSSYPPEKPSKDQVVVLRVSLHCKGCEGKLRKHLSRMEGVTSFNIDFAAKKVTIVGDVTPLGVLASVSKVKSAQFWTSTMPVAASSSNMTNK
ncbi:heavy-metal-associated domain-containing family protein [Gossypium australe]|uniref:Heavy-metal-associated domain-containing family protein n=1 Tax=Gossypium australe TaxID=47621 RepID=A0A5B6V4B0_9ROSI|nr:heavy-metal-associated domain-containing family protein [Gossypium australe]